MGRSGAGGRRLVAVAGAGALVVAGCDLGVPAQSYVVAAPGQSAVDVTAFDHQADGDLDLLVTTTDGFSIAVNDGTGAFGHVVPAGGPTAGGSAALGDIDGRLGDDLVISQPSLPAPHVRVAFDRTAHAPVDLAVPATAEGPITTEPVVADIDGDGDGDIVAATDGPGWGSHLFWWENVGGGFAASAVRDEYPVSDLLVTDVDGDGVLDIVAAHWGDFNVGIGVIHGNGDGTFAPTQVHLGGTGFDGAPQVVAGDVDGDGDTDVVGRTGNPGEASTVFAMLNDGDGGFGYPADTVWSPAPHEDTEVAAGDIDGDGDLDVATDSAVLFGNGDGSFGNAHEVAGGSEVVVADVDGEGSDDLAYLVGDSVVVLANGLDA